MLEQKLVVGRYIDLPFGSWLTLGPDVHGFRRASPDIRHINESTSMSFLGPRKSDTGVGQVGKARRNFIWLPYLAGCVSEVSVAGTDVLTGPMSGCWLTIANNRAYHVGTHDTDAQKTQRAKGAWNGFAAGLPAGSATGFKPSDYWSQNIPVATGNDSGLAIFGLITFSGEFYSIVAWLQREKIKKPGDSDTLYRIAHVRLEQNTLPQNGQVP